MGRLPPRGRLHRPFNGLAGASLPRAGASAVKAIPGAGWLVGALAQVALSGATTYALGNVFRRHFEENGDLHELEAERVRGDYERDLMRGRRTIREIRTPSCSATTCITLRGLGDPAKEQP